MFYWYQNWSEVSLMQVKNDDDIYKGQRLTQVKCGKQCPIATYIGQKNHSASQRWWWPL